MSIGNHERQQAIQPIGVTADDLSATGDAAWIFDVVAPIEILRVGALISTVLVGAATVTFDKRITTGSDTGRVDAAFGTIIIPTTTAAGKLVYKDVTTSHPTANPGDQVVPEVTSAATSGAARYFLEYIQRDNVAAELTDMVATA